MVWTHSGRMHWTTTDVKGLIVDVRITKKIVTRTIIDAETGEIKSNKQFDHPLDAMKSVENNGQ